ncbi:MAG: hypothetical protein MJ252_01005 [archaeon]|nr:hypothetical protein [archaeon]
MKDFENRFRDLQSNFKKKRNQMDSILYYYDYFWTCSKEYLQKLKNINTSTKSRIKDDSM